VAAARAARRAALKTYRKFSHDTGTGATGTGGKARTQGGKGRHRQNTAGRTQRGTRRLAPVYWSDAAGQSARPGSPNLLRH
jgi:hypothetical protein